MSGHSKWSKVKHQKATTDAVKASAFTKASRAITIAVREGGGISDPDMNFRLRLAVEKAKEVNMPKENIARAIEKGKGAPGTDIFQVTYEAFGPYGSAFIIEAATDNKQRTVSALKNILEHHGGTLAAPGAVSYMFQHLGLILAPKSKSLNEMISLALDSGADDVTEFDNEFEIYTKPNQLAAVRNYLGKQGITVENSRLVMQPLNLVSLLPDQLTKIQDLVDQLEEMDDIQNVYTNFG